MRKLKLQMQTTIDGLVAGTNGEMNWITHPWTEDINNYVESNFKNMDTIVLGRKLAEGFIPYWDEVASDPSNPEHSSGIQFTDTPKIVFSKTLETSKWKNTSIANGDIADEINKLKNKKGNDIFAFGGANFVSNLIKHGLIDEYFLFINPSAIGKGLSIFNEINENQSYKLKDSRTFDCGIVALNYESGN